MAGPWEDFQQKKETDFPWLDFQSKLIGRTGMPTSETAIKTGPGPNVVNIAGSGAIEGAANIAAIPRAVATNVTSAIAAQPGPAPGQPAGVRGPRVPGGIEHPPTEAQRAAAQLPTQQEALKGISETTGIPIVEPKEASGRIEKAIASGAVSGLVAGPIGSVGGALAGAGGQTAEEAGLPPWAQAVVSLALPLLASRGVSGGKPFVPTITQLRLQADTAYRTAESAGLVVPQSEMLKIATDMTQHVLKAGIDKTLHPRATAAFLRVLDAAKTDQSLQKLEIVRRIIGGAAKSIDPDERRIAKIMLDRLDSQIEDVGQSEARRLWARMRKAETIEDAVTKANRRSSSTSSGGNTDNTIRQNIRGILDSPKKIRGFTQEERAVMERIVRGAPVQNLLRLIGKFSPEGNGLMGMLGILGATINPLVAIPSAVGFVAKRVATGMTNKNVKALDELVRAGKPIGRAPTSQQKSLISGGFAGTIGRPATMNRNR